jgi:hypothetical protein
VFQEARTRYAIVIYVFYAYPHRRVEVLLSVDEKDRDIKTEQDNALCLPWPWGCRTGRLNYTTYRINGRFNLTKLQLKTIEGC